MKKKNLLFTLLAFIALATPILAQTFGNYNFTIERLILVNEKGSLADLSSFKQLPSSMVGEGNYKIKDEETFPMYFLLNGKIVSGTYIGQHAKMKINGEKYNLPHGKGKFTSQSINYDGDWYEGKMQGKGTLNVVDWTYKGDITDGLANGEGKLSYNIASLDSTKTIEGTFKNGKANGKVFIAFISGKEYTGDAFEGKLQGQGKLIYKDKSKDRIGAQVIPNSYYEGSWNNNVRDGIGTTYYQNGEKLEGLWKNDLFNGKGKLTLFDSTLYDGQWKDGLPHGKGIQTDKYGSLCEGDFNQGKFTGHGTWCDKNGKYVGYFINDVKEGQGKNTYNSGDIEEGIFSKNKLIKGEKKNADGTFEKGTWDDKDGFKGFGKRISSNQSIWEGEWKGIMPIDSGKINWANGNTYEGEWGGYIETDSEKEFVYWCMEGKGRLTIVNGDVYVGNLHKGKKSGYGKMTYQDGTVYEGEWENDETTSPQMGTFKDSRDGKVYKTVKIGTQTWMAENFAFKAIGGCWALDNKISNVNKFGYLYNWETAKKVCPKGWHLPTENEFEILRSYLGGAHIACEKLKSTSGWDNGNDDNENGNNESGFNAFPSGKYYDSSTTFSKDVTSFWGSDETYNYNDFLNRSKILAVKMDIHIVAGVILQYDYKDYGLSVRYIKDK